MPVFRSKQNTTLAALAAIADPINTSGKFPNKIALVVEGETNREYRALGAAPGDAWRPRDDQSGLSDVTPA